MSTEIERYKPTTAAERAPTELDQWVLVVRDVSTLASQIADTPFVPESMRGNPAAVVAAILAGREAGVGPMTALQHIHVIKGKPGQSAQLMRQLVLGAGHSIRYVETNDSRCVVEGRRRGEDRWERVTFTADQAKRAKIDLGGYPEDKLVARATVRLCRRLFADCIGGMPYTVEELTDGEFGDEPRALPSGGGDTNGQPAEPAKRTAKRKTPTREPKAAQTTGEAQAPVTAASAGPPLPGEEGYEQTGGPDEGQPVGAELVTDAQLQKLHIQLGEFGLTEREDKLTTVSLLVKRELGSSKELTKAEASGVIDLFERLTNEKDPSRALDAVLASLEQTGSEQDGASA